MVVRDNGVVKSLTLGRSSTCSRDSL